MQRARKPIPSFDQLIFLPTISLQKKSNHILTDGLIFTS
jgi:hypothetical protein